MDLLDLGNLSEDDQLLLDEDMDVGGEDFLSTFHSLMGDEDHSISASVLAESKDSSAKTASGRKNAAERANKKRKCNPDADAIAAVTEESMKALNIDMDSKDAKKMRRQIRNRLSAQFHRDRKNAHIHTLEETVAANTKLIEQLQAEVRHLRAENARLQALASQQALAQALEAASCASSAAGTDAESVSASPSSSPFHFAEADPPVLPLPATAPRGALGTGLPLPRALGFVAVLCVLCVACMTTMPGMPLPPLGQPSPLGAPGRRLSALEDLPMAPPPPRPRNASTAFTAPPSPPRQNLRAAAAPRNESMALFARDLVPFWPAPPLGAQSLSRVALQAGVALFDPALQLPAAAVWPPVSLRPFGVDAAPVPASAPAAPSREPRATAAVLLQRPPPALPEPPGGTEAVEDKRWPALSTIASAPATDGPSRCAHCAQCGDCAAEKRALVQSLAAGANLVTVTLPASAVRLGRSLEQSEAGSVDSLLRLFNLSAPNASAQGQGDGPGLLNTAQAVVELDCVLLSAKLLVREQTSQ